MRERVGGAMVATLILWSSAFIAIRAVVPTVGFLGLSVGRLVIASVALAAVTPLIKVPVPQRVDLVRIALCGLTGMAAYQLLLNAGEITVQAGVASLLVNTGPIFAAILAWWLLGEPLTRTARAGVLVSFAGAAIIAFGNGSGLRLSSGAVLVLGAALSQSLFFVLSKPLGAKYGSFAITCYAMWSGTMLLLPLLPWTTARLTHATAAAWGSLLFLGVGASAIGFVTWVYAQARMSVAIATNLLYLVPFLASGIGWLLLDERPTVFALLGGVIVLIGVAVSRWRPRTDSAGAGPDQAAVDHPPASSGFTRLRARGRSSTVGRDQDP